MSTSKNNRRVEIPRSYYERISTIAHRQDRTVADVVRQLLHEALDAHADRQASIQGVSPWQLRLPGTAPIGSHSATAAPDSSQPSATAAASTSLEATSHTTA